MQAGYNLPRNTLTGNEQTTAQSASISNSKNRIPIQKLFTVQALLWLALVLALVGSLRHVAWGFSTLEQGDLTAGYIQAIAVDIGLFALAIGIQQHRKQGRRSIGLWAGVVLFSGVSTYANLLHGLVYAAPIALQGWDWLIFARPFVLSAVLPILVVYLSEIAASDVNYAAQVAERERKATERKLTREVSITTGIDASPEQAEYARTVKAEQDTANKNERLKTIVDTLRVKPDTGATQLAEQLNVSRTTVYNYLDELVDNGRVHKNGDGYKVVAQ
jgi:predicted transcriptional regulator